MAGDKLLAEWFWVDRWMGSRAYGLPIGARGLYREMLSQAWLRGARLPNDHTQIRRFTAITIEEWTDLWPFVAQFWRVDGAYLVNDTQIQVYTEAKSRQDRAQARAHVAARASAQARLKQSPPSPSPSPSLISESDSKKKRTVAAPLSPLRLPVENLKIITKLAHQVLKSQNGHKVGSADLCEQIKTLCATRKIAYDASVVRKALDSAEVQRKTARVV